MCLGTSEVTIPNGMILSIFTQLVQIYIWQWNEAVLSYWITRQWHTKESLLEDQSFPENQIVSSPHNKLM